MQPRKSAPFEKTRAYFTVDGHNPAPLKERWKDDSLVNPNKQWFPMVSKWCRISSIHSITIAIQDIVMTAEMGQTAATSWLDV